MASRAASCLGISVFHRRFASGIYQTLLLWVVLFLPFVCICQSEWLRCGFESLHLCVSWLKWLIYDSLIRIFVFFFFLSHWYHIYLPYFGFYYSWDQWVLDFWKLGLSVFVIGIIYTKFFILFLYIKLLLRSVASWILAFIYQYIISLCVWKLCFL